MAEWGGVVFGDADNEQVSNLAVTMAFVGKGSITLNQHQAAFQTPTFDRAYLGGSPAQAAGGMLCAFRPRFSDRPVGVWQFNPGDGTTYFVGYGPNGPVSGEYPVVDWWMFGRPTKAAEGWGAEAYDDQGVVTWASAGRPMDIAAVTNDGLRTAIAADRSGDWAICVGLPAAAVRSGSETSSSGQFRWLETRLMWGAPNANGFAAPSSYPVAQGGPTGSYPTGWREGDMRATQLLVDVAGL